MKRYFILAALTVFFGGVTACVAQSHENANPANKQFVHGKHLIQNNCIDCMRGSRAGMEEGIKEVEAALSAGYPNKKAAYKLLEEAYANMTTYTDKDPQRHEIYLAKQSEIAKKLYELAPEDADALQAYADTLPENEEKMKVLKRITEISPNRTDAKYELGLLTARKGNLSKGLELIEAAIQRQANPEVILTYVQGLLNVFDEHGCPLPEENQWLQKSNDAFVKSTSGAGDPQALPEFKKQFLDAVKKHNCVNPQGPK